MAVPPMAWNPLFLAGGATALVGLVFAVYVFAARPTLQNRALAAFLAFGAIGELLSAWRFLLVDPTDAFAAWLVRHAHLPLLVSTLLVFYSTLPTPLARPLRPLGVRAGLVAAGVLFAVVTLRDPALLATGVSYDAAARVWISHGDGPLWAPPIFALLGGVLLGPVFTLSALREARAEEERRKLRALAAAFALFAAAQSATIVLILVLIDATGWLLALVTFVALPASNLVLVSMLAYGILRAQLFGAELRLKWTLSRGTTAAAFVGVFFVASEGAQQLFEARFGPVFGVAAAGLLVFAIAPLQRAADRLADRAMPRVHDTPEYRHERGRAIYRAALESATRDGVVTDRERDVLATLQEELGIPATEALAMERDAAAAAR